MIELAIAAGAAVVAIFLAFLKGQSTGAARNEAKHQVERIKARDTAAKVDDDLAKQSPDANREALKTWGPDS